MSGGAGWGSGSGSGSEWWSGSGPRYWNEETQRWEDADGARPGAEPGERAGSGPESGHLAGTEEVNPEAPTASVTPPPDWHSVLPPVPPSNPPPSHLPPSHLPPPTLSSGLPPTTFSTGLPPDPSPSARPAYSRRLVWSVVVGAAVVGVAVSLVLTFVVDRGGDDGKGGGGRTVAASSSGPGASQSTDGSPAPSPSPSASTPELPAGYTSFDDPEGFRIAHPDGWTRSTVASTYGIDVVNYRSGDGEHRLQVYQVAEPTPAASFELYLSDQTPKPDGFRKLALQTLDDGSFTGTRLEYTADSLKGEPDIGTWHVYDERFVASDGAIYAIAAYGPDADGRSDELELLATAVTWFCPQAGTCDDASVN
ncbi:hypothetical protein [Streptomyces sp. NPDC096142]|uniref:hypothetical protein n=1 Tax=Streptomyces sp. NPDC096142 TaxID=3366077 RepID=UPI0037FB0F76